MRGSIGAGGFERLRVVMSLGLSAMVLVGLCFRDPHPLPLPAALRLQGEGSDSFSLAAIFAAGEKVRMRGGTGTGEIKCR